MLVTAHLQSSLNGVIPANDSGSFPTAGAVRSGDDPRLKQPGQHGAVLRQKGDTER